MKASIPVFTFYHRLYFIYNGICAAVNRYAKQLLRINEKTRYSSRRNGYRSGFYGLNISGGNSVPQQSEVVNIREGNCGKFVRTADVICGAIDFLSIILYNYRDTAGERDQIIGGI